MFSFQLLSTRVNHISSPPTQSELCTKKSETCRALACRYPPMILTTSHLSMILVMGRLRAPSTVSSSSSFDSERQFTIRNLRPRALTARGNSQYDIFVLRSLTVTDVRWSPAAFRSYASHSHSGCVSQRCVSQPLLVWRLQTTRGKEPTHSHSSSYSMFYRVFICNDCAVPRLSCGGRVRQVDGQWRACYRVDRPITHFLEIPIED